MPDLPTIDTVEISISLAIMIVIVMLTLRTRAVLRRRDRRFQETQQLILRLEADHRYFLTARSLGPLHEKINEVAKNVAAINAQQEAQTEQLRVITRYILPQP